MTELLAQPNSPDFDWTSLIYLGLLVLGGLSSIITKVFGKKDETVDAEIDDAPATRPQPQRPVARAPQTTQRPPLPAAPPQQPSAPPARPQPARPLPPRAPVSQPRQQPAARTPSRPRPRPAQRPERQPSPSQSAHVRTHSAPVEAGLDAVVEFASATPEPIETSSGAPQSRQFDMNAESLRRAIVLKEILGPPVALRNGDDAPFASNG